MTDSTIHAQRAVIASFNAAAKKYRSTYADHCNNPCSGEALEVTENRAVAAEKHISELENEISGYDG